ncbi:hypothetical protein N0V88_003581 [Collariella sp. IMI 366227]|nr:hypothetical protein N0V88_003581 [Collariella sp. IMI 366227]
MKPTIAAAHLLGWTAPLAAAAAVSASEFEHRIPSSAESAVLGRRILALTPVGTLSTVFPEDKHSDGASTQERRPPGLEGMPYGLMEYIADCEADELGNPTILAITIGTTFRNAAAGSNVSLAVQWTPPHPPAKRIKAMHNHKKKRNWLSSFLNLETPPSDHYHDHHDNHPTPPLLSRQSPRFSLLGYLQPIPSGDDRSTPIGAALAQCYVNSHPDAKYWLPGNRIHDAHFVRLVVEQVYWVGGFGDRAFIGWIPVEEWRNVTRKDWEKVQLPGEKKGWKEWATNEAAEDL